MIPTRQMIARMRGESKAVVYYIIGFAKLSLVLPDVDLDTSESPIPTVECINDCYNMADIP